jgi:hypothetical protein
MLLFSTKLRIKKYLKRRNEKFQKRILLNESIGKNKEQSKSKAIQKCTTDSLFVLVIVYSYEMCDAIQFKKKRFQGQKKKVSESK